MFIGNCCPVGKICNDSDGCEDPPDVSIAQSCPAGWIGCPASLRGGCCRSGQLCGIGVCYDGTPHTFQVSETKTTTDSKGHTTTTVVTSLSVITEGPLSSSPAAAIIPQLVPSTVAKLDALQTNDSDDGGSGGLSSGALGGIITGVIVLLIAIVVAAVFIVLRLKKAERAAKDAEKAAVESKHDSSNSQSRSHKSGSAQVTISEIGSNAETYQSYGSRYMSLSPRSRSASAGSAPNTVNLIHSDTSSLPSSWTKIFHYTPSEASDDNAPTRMSQRVSVDSQAGTCRHGRQPSDVSELEGIPSKAELEASESAQADAQRQPNNITQSTRPRRNSDLSNQNRARSDSNTRTLRTVDEIVELHGHYGSPDKLAGQTIASLSRDPSTTCSSPTHQHS